MPDALPLAEPVHSIPGRSRLRIDARRGDSVFFASIATGLAAIGGVTRVDVRPLTGSVVIHHGPPLARIGIAAEEARLFSMTKPVDAAASATALAIDAKMVAALGIGAFGLWQFAQGRVLPPAMTMAWYAATLAGLLPQNADPAGPGE